MLLARITRLAAAALVGITLAGGLSLAAQPAHADEWGGTSAWLNTMSHSRAHCAGGGITIDMVANEPYGTTRTEYLEIWNGSQFVYSGQAVSAVSNGAAYFVYRNGYFLPSTDYAASLLYPARGRYYRVYETMTRNGVMLSQNWFLKYMYSTYASDIDWCTS